MVVKFVFYYNEYLQRKYEETWELLVDYLRCAYRLKFCRRISFHAVRDPERKSRCENYKRIRRCLVLVNSICVHGHEPIFNIDRWELQVKKRNRNRKKEISCWRYHKY